MNYWAKAIASSARHLAADITQPRKRRFEFTKRWLSTGLSYECQPRAKTADLLDLFPEAETVTVPIQNLRYARSNTNPYELFCLCGIAMLKQARRLFEIGTFDGATTAELAKACPDAAVFTMDLPPSLTAALEPALVASETQNVHNNGVGARYRDTPESARIVQLYGDSTRYDYGEYNGTMDFVFIDACHEYEFVQADTKTALKLIRPGGVIFWHDYEPGWPGVVRAVDALLDRYPIRHIDKTALAVLDTSIGGRVK